MNRSDKNIEDGVIVAGAGIAGMIVSLLMTAMAIKSAVTAFGWVSILFLFGTLLYLSVSAEAFLCYRRMHGRGFEKRSEVSKTIRIVGTLLWSLDAVVYLMMVAMMRWTDSGYVSDIDLIDTWAPYVFVLFPPMVFPVIVKKLFDLRRLLPRAQATD